MRKVAETWTGGTVGSCGTGWRNWPGTGDRASTDRTIQGRPLFKQPTQFWIGWRRRDVDREEVYSRNGSSGILPTSACP